MRDDIHFQKLIEEIRGSSAKQIRSTLWNKDGVRREAAGSKDQSREKPAGQASQ